MLAPESIKEMVKTPSMFLPSESPGSSEAPLLLQAQRPVQTHTTVLQHSLNTGSACLWGMTIGRYSAFEKLEKGLEWAPG